MSECTWMPLWFYEILSQILWYCVIVSESGGSNGSRKTHEKVADKRPLTSSTVSQQGIIYLQKVFIN